MMRRIIPCLDLSNGRVVKGVRFENLRDQGDPVEIAIRYAAAGADELAMLDISATVEGRQSTLQEVSRVAQAISIPIIFGGGINDVESARRALAAGASKITVNTAAVQRPDLLAELASVIGTDSLVLSVDALRNPEPDSGWEVVTHGGRQHTGMSVVDWCRRAVELGAGEILLTSIDRDGTQDGYDLDLIHAVASVVTVPVIASGGAGHPQHLAAALQAGADAVLAASIFHEGQWTIGQVKRWLSRQGFAVRNTSFDHSWLDEVRWDSNGLVPVIVEANDGTRMLGYADKTALQKTMETGYLWLFSRSRQQLWQKGETSGNRQRVVAIDLDCDRDAVRIRVIPEGSTCHTGNDSCFFDQVWVSEKQPPAEIGHDLTLDIILPQLEDQINDRLQRMPEGSYVARLGNDHDYARRKVGEEAIEFILATSSMQHEANTSSESRRAVVHEAADLLFHWLVLLRIAGIQSNEIAEELRRRFRPR